MRKGKNGKQIKSERNFFDQSGQGVPVSLTQFSYSFEVRGGTDIYHWDRRRTDISHKGQWRGDISALRCCICRCCISNRWQRRKDISHCGQRRRDISHWGHRRGVISHWDQRRVDISHRGQRRGVISHWDQRRVDISHWEQRRGVISHLYLTFALLYLLACSLTTLHVQMQMLI